MAARSNSIDQWIDTVGNYYKKLPELSKNGKDVVVLIVPWLAIIFGVIGILLSLFRLGIFSLPLAFIFGNNNANQSIILVLAGLAASILMVAAYPGVKNRQGKGWRLLYYSEVVTLVFNVLTLNIFGVLFTLVGFYFLYQIRNYYK